jgi:hypothetical protein
MAKGGSGGSYRSVISGRYVTSAHGQRSPRTTVKEAFGPKGSSGDHYRSAISGRYVTDAHGRRSPNTTEKNS